MKIKFETVEDVITFTTMCEKHYKGLIFAEQDNKTINAKSLLGIYTLDVFKPMKIVIETDYENEKDSFYCFIKKWKVED